MLCSSLAKRAGRAVAKTFGVLRPAHRMQTAGIADLRSDTVTKPDAEMTIAMMDAVTGDDVMREGESAAMVDRQEPQFACAAASAYEASAGN